MCCHRLIKGQSNQTNLYRIPPLMHSWYHETHLFFFLARHHETHLALAKTRKSGRGRELIRWLFLLQERERVHTCMNPNLTFIVTIFSNINQTCIKKSKKEVSFCQSYFTRKVFNIQKYFLCWNRRSLSLTLPVFLLLLAHSRALSLSLSLNSNQKNEFWNLGIPFPFRFVCVCVGWNGPTDDMSYVVNML